MTVSQTESVIAPRVPAATRVGQGTAVEQSRAVAEVEAAIVVAMRYPRNVPAAIAAMQEACAQIELAEVAFYEFPRGKEIVEGPSIHLARELARVWGNIQYGVHELIREDGRGQSEMLAFAWDVQTNTRNSATFIVPHARDTRDGIKQLTDMRDIYENNANNGARRVREAIFAVLPKWFTRQAEECCRATLRDGGGVPVAQRTADVIARFAKGGITVAQLEQRVGRPSAEWIPDDLAKLHVVYTSLKRGDITKAEAFPQDRVTAAEITGQPKADPPPDPPADPPQKLADLLRGLQLGGPDDDGQDLILTWLAGSPWKATRAQVRLVTPMLADFLFHAGGDYDEARSTIWVRYHEQNPDANPGGSEPS